MLEKSTRFHNTVFINERDQDILIDSFKVGMRKKIIKKELHGKEFLITLKYAGIPKIIHTRKVKFANKQISIEDFVNGISQSGLHIHLHPKVRVKKINNNQFVLNEDILITFEGNIINSFCEKYECAESFNSLVTANRITTIFERSAITIIQVN